MICLACSQAFQTVRVQSVNVQFLVEVKRARRSISSDLQTQDEVKLPQVLHLVSLRHLALEAKKGVELDRRYGKVIHIDSYNDEPLGVISDIG